MAYSLHLPMAFAKNQNPYVLDHNPSSPHCFRIDIMPVSWMEAQAFLQLSVRSQCAWWVSSRAGPRPGDPHVQALPFPPAQQFSSGGDFVLQGIW